VLAIQTNGIVSDLLHDEDRIGMVMKEGKVIVDRRLATE
jgi:hypothetical protein